MYTIHARQFVLGWKVERQQKPPSLHCTILPHHVVTADNFLKDLELSVAEAKVCMSCYGNRFCISNSIHYNISRHI